MAVYAISDLHLPIGVHKPMDVFGPRWTNYVDRLMENWTRIVSPEDCVVVPGDISWATYLEEAEADLRFLDSLPGIKVVSKGNHDYWWESLTKLKAFSEEKGFSSLVFLHNSAYLYKDTAIFATRGWLTPADTNYLAHKDEKLYKRELMRMELSAAKAKELSPKRMVAAIHYPPHREFLRVLEEISPTVCVYGHLHGVEKEEKIVSSTKIKLVSCDFLEFSPIKILD